MKTPSSTALKLAVFAMLVPVSSVSAQRGTPITAPLMLLLDESCAAGETLCGASCVNIQSNLNHCGACNSFCSGWCGNGSCLTAGVCSAGTAPSAEICDALDNDCDGVVDGPGANASCDDGNQCTTDSCAAGGCAHTVNVHSACDDGDPNTVNDLCTRDGRCTGTPL